MKTFNKGDVVCVAAVLATDNTAPRGAYPLVSSAQSAKAGLTAVVTDVSSRNGFVELDGEEGVFYHPDWLTPVPSMSVTTASSACAPTATAISSTRGINRAEDRLFARMPSTAISRDTYEKKENKFMNLKSLFGSIRYGQVTDGSVRLSMSGPAFRNAEGVYVNYDKTTGHITNVDIASFDADGMAYYIPTPIQSIVAGDYIEHNGKPCCVIDATDGNLTVVNVYSGVAEAIKPTKNLFGGCFVSKIASLFEAFQPAATAAQSGSDAQSNPMAAILPFLLLGGMEKKGGASKVLPLMLMSGMANGGNGCGFGNFLSNPFALMLLLDDDTDMESILPMMAMMGGFGGAATGAPAVKTAEKPAAEPPACTWATCDTATAAN